MLSSAWHSLTGRKHSRDDEKKEAEEHKSFDMQPLQSTPSTAAPTTLTAAPSRGGRKKSKTEQQLRSTAVPTPTIAITPSSASTLSYVAPPMVAPDAASVPQLAHPDHPPPSYAASMLHQYPIASAPQQPVVFIDGHPEGSSGAAEQKWPQSSEHAVEEHKFPSSSSQEVHIAPPLPSQPSQPTGLPVAVPLMADQPEPLTQRWTRSATAAFLALQSNPTFQRGHAKAVALAGKHIPPEVVEFIQAPSIGKLLRHPTYLFIVYRLYASVRAPFIGLFRAVLVNAAKKALWRRKMSEKDMKVNADKTNAAINEGLKQAIGKDMNVQLSPEVCKQIVDNIDMKQVRPHRRHTHIAYSRQ